MNRNAPGRRCDSLRSFDGGRPQRPEETKMPVAQEALDRLLVGFLHYDADAAQEFRRVAPPIIRGLARRFGPDLPADVIDEVVSETYLLLLGCPGASFDPSRGSAQKFLLGIVANAVKNVRAGYRSPAARARQRKTDISSEPIVPFDELQHGLEERLLPDAQQVNAAIDVARLLSGLTTLLAAAIIAVHIRGHNMSKVARILGVSRFKIRRGMRQVQVRAMECTDGAGKGRASMPTIAA